MEKRLIIYGDIHGCFEEFVILRDNLHIKKNDIEVSVGDFLNKGPYSIETLHFFYKNSILSVRGNHEDKFVKYDLYKKNRGDFIKLNSMEKNIYQNLTQKDIEFLKKLPFYLRFGELTVVHGGVWKGLFFKNATKEDFEKVMRIRFVDKNGNFVNSSKKKMACCYWSELYDGHEGFIVYGHQPFLNPKIDRFSIGIDTGAVYGNYLSAVIFDMKKDRVILPSYRFEMIKSKEYVKKDKPWLNF